MVGYGKTFKVGEVNAIIDGCTVSSADVNGAVYFALAANTDISPEIYDSKKLIFVNGGTLIAYTGKGFGEGVGKGFGEGFSREVKENQAIYIGAGAPLGMKSETGAVYTELTLRSNTKMNKIIKDGNVFSLKDLVPYQEGKIVNMDVASNEKMKFVVMSFDKGTGLSEHAAPGEALIFALDGEGIIGYEGKEYKIKAGENFKFAKQGRHYVKANEKFKMALFLTLE